MSDRLFCFFSLYCEAVFIGAQSGVDFVYMKYMFLCKNESVDRVNQTLQLFLRHEHAVFWCFLCSLSYSLLFIF